MLGFGLGGCFEFFMGVCARVREIRMAFNSESRVLVYAVV